jgi:hypothetical protein
MSTWTGAVSTDWNNAGNWAAGGTGTGIPSATVDAIFSGTPTRPCVLGANRTCRALTFTAYTSTVDLATFTLTANNNITFQADQSSRVLGTTGILSSGASQTITSNLGTWPLNYSIANVASITITLADNMVVSGSYSASGGSRIINGFSLFVGTNLTSSATHSGTTNFIMNGSGTYSGTSACNLEIDTSGTIIITGSIILTRRFIITNVGTITMTSANVSIQDTTTINLGGRIIGNLSHTFTVGSTVTYLTDVYCSNFTIGNGSNIYNGPGRIYASGNYTMGGTSSGTLVVELKGTGTISTGTMGLSCIISSSGTYTLGATLTLGTNISFTCSTPTLNTATSTVTINSGVTISTLGVNWYNITIPASATITINQLLSIINILSLSGTTTFTGTAGWTCNTLSLTAAGAFIITLQNAITYITITSAQLTGGTNAARYTMTSNSGTIRAIWTLTNGASQALTYVNGTRIDSSAGQTVYTFGGTISTTPVGSETLNWLLLTPPRTVAYTFVN